MSRSFVRPESRSCLAQNFRTGLLSYCFSFHEKFVVNVDCSFLQDCQDTLLADHDDQMYSLKATAIDPVLTVQPKLFQGWCTTVKGYQRYENIEVTYALSLHPKRTRPSAALPELCLLGYYI